MINENAYTISSEKVKRILGLEFSSKEKTFGDLGVQLVEIEEAEKQRQD